MSLDRVCYVVMRLYITSMSSSALEGNDEFYGSPNSLYQFSSVKDR